MDTGCTLFVLFTLVLLQRSSRSRFTYLASNSGVNPFYDASKKHNRRVNSGTFTQIQFNRPPAFVPMKSKSGSLSVPSIIMRGKTGPHASPSGVINTTPATTTTTSTTTHATVTINATSQANDTTNDKQGYFKSFFNKVLSTFKAAQSLSSYVIPSSTGSTSYNASDATDLSHLNSGNHCALAHWVIPTSNITNASTIAVKSKVSPSVVSSLTYNSKGNFPNLPSVITRSRSRLSLTDDVKVLISVEVWQENLRNFSNENTLNATGSVKSKMLIGKFNDEQNISLNIDPLSTNGWIEGAWTSVKYLNLLNASAKSPDDGEEKFGKLTSLKYRWRIIEELVSSKDVALKSNGDNSLTSGPLGYGVPGESSDVDNSIDSAAGHPVASETTTKTPCPEGFTGPECKDVMCSEKCHPVHGYCEKANECKCRFGWTGALCGQCKTMPGCVHGTCQKPFECRCEEGWTGMFCDKPTCKIGCHPQNGYCEQPGECRCRFGFKGDNCSDCSTMPGCQRGTCDQPLDCNCEAGWKGMFCSIPLCSQGCDIDHGWCRRPEECRCRLGWTGSNCTQCVPYPGCLHGTCTEPWTCNCKPGWGGVKCDEQLNTCETLQPCQNGGTCVSIEKNDGGYTCHCGTNFTGENCTITARSF